MDKNIDNQDNRLGGIFLIIGWAIAIVLFGLLINKIMFTPKPPTVQQTYAGTEITIYRDFDSHFRIEGMVNNVAVTFLIDTGATTTAVSMHLASNAGLERKGLIETETANGNTVGYMTKIAKLKLADIEIPNVAAIIIENLPSNEALLGMNVLKHFDLQQNDNELKLIIPK